MLALQFRNACTVTPEPGCYDVRAPLDLAIVAAATAGACIGFLWWNAAPAKIIIDDAGSFALGAAEDDISRAIARAVALRAPAGFARSPVEVIAHASSGCRDTNTRLARFAAKPNLVRGPTTHECWHNAVAESFCPTLKALFYDQNVSRSGRWRSWLKSVMNTRQLSGGVGLVLQLGSSETVNVVAASSGLVERQGRMQCVRGSGDRR